MPDPVASIEASVASVSPKTQWIFVEVVTRSGLRGWGEATLLKREDRVLSAIEELASIARAAPSASPDALPASRHLADLPTAAAWCALDQALWDIQAGRMGKPLAEALGDKQRDSIGLYANINRRTLDRTPDGFAASARAALEAGFSAIKIAPLDEIDPSSGPGDFVAAIERIEAVRQAIGNARLMVDCHWRLNAATAEWLIAAVAPYHLHWLECPIAEDEAAIPVLKRLRAAANARGMRLAGCEENIRAAGFAPFLDGGAYDVLMPDAKYAGGMLEMLKLSRLFAHHGVEFSPHNPTGPICHAASLHVCAVASSLDALEVQFGETHWFDDLQEDPLQNNTDGTASLPLAAGLGTRIESRQLAKCCTLRWRSR